MLFAGMLKKPIAVTFKEEHTGRVVATWRMPLDKLPLSFSELRLEMGGGHYAVVDAHPSTRNLVAETRQLTVVIRTAAPPAL